MKQPLSVTHPQLSEEWHPTKNGDLTPDQVRLGTDKKVWWLCSEGPDHEWEASPNKRTSAGRGCPFCSGRRASVTNSLASLYPELVREWHPTNNGTLGSDGVVAGSNKKVWWRCRKGPDHEWQATITSRTKVGRGCPYCSGSKVSVTNSLASLYPELAKEWHPTKNGELTPENVVPGSNTKVWWQCLERADHEWQVSVGNRTSGGTGCPSCTRWTLTAIRSFVSSLKDHLSALTPAELYLLFQQSGLLHTKGSSKAFVKALVTGRFPHDEIEKFVVGEPSHVDDFIANPNQTLEAHEINGRSSLFAGSKEVDGTSDNGSVTIRADLDDEVDELVSEMADEDEQELPVVETKEALAALDHAVVASTDGEAIEFLLASAVDKIWKHAFRNEDAAIAQAESFSGGEYAERIRKRFLDEYNQAKELRIPQGYAFKVDGKRTPPNLMQRLVATRVQTGKRVGNWSGTGAGKTLSAVLATRVVASNLTVIRCPNSVVEGWQEAISDYFPHSAVACKNFDPHWASLTGDEIGLGTAASDGVPRYLILNYEAFQQDDSVERVRSLVERELIDFIIVDEIHHTKQRTAKNVSRRRKLVTALASLAAERNPELYVLGMSATPVINNLQEGKSLVELVSGVIHDDLGTYATSAASNLGLPPSVQQVAVLKALFAYFAFLPLPYGGTLSPLSREARPPLSRRATSKYLPTLSHPRPDRALAHGGSSPMKCVAKEANKAK